MYIESVTVEGGFLDGLNLDLRPGLNVLIGSRGVGKSSVIELVRLALGSGNVTEEGVADSRRHALSVLADGRVTVHVRDGADRLVFSRTADDEPATLSLASSFTGVRPLVLGQGDVERVALNAEGRMRLIDAFLESSKREEAVPSASLAMVRSQTAHLREIGAEVLLLDEKVRELPDARAALSVAESEDERMRSSVEAVAADLARLDEIGREIATVGVARDTLERSSHVIDTWVAELRQVISRVPYLQYDDDETRLVEEPLEAVNAGLSAVVASLQTSLDEVADHREELQRRHAQSQITLDGLNATAVELRRRVESVHEGAGETARRLASLRERVAQIAAMEKLAGERRAAADRLRAERDTLLDEIDRLSDARFSERKAVVDSINAEVGPQLNVKLERGGLHGAYVAALSSALRGSGLQYTALAPRIAESLSPRELLDAVDSGATAQVAQVAGINADRADRLIRHLQDHGMDEIVSTPIDDGVTLGLWDGSDYRQTGQLSTGQRCTVVLPVLLLHREHPVIVDQPEDNLDNAYIVESLVGVLAKRGTDGQVICATHNPNIPVLGGATRVIQLDSDGRRGFARVQGELDKPEVVEAITTIMEGGREAFAKRAEFYGLS